MTPKKTIPPTQLGEEIREAREAARLTQAELAGRAGLPRGQVEISEIERGKHQAAWQVIVAIRRALKLK
jgi:transcriptional regulator with XRE-family HTH domain